MQELISKSMKILVIDDSKETTTMLQKYFDAHKHETTVTNDSMEGLNYIRGEQFDVILLCFHDYLLVFFRDDIK